jgi:serine/threonine protein kinase
MLVYEYAPEGSLLSLLECNSPSLTLRRRMELAVDIADAMEFVASKNMVHRDLRA